MTVGPSRLAELMTPRSTEGADFEATGVAGRAGRFFGGALSAQMLMAAADGVPSGQDPHSLHCHFISAGDPGSPIAYETTVLRASRRFTTTRVDARQGTVLVASSTASFHAPEVTPEHRAPMPALAAAGPPEREPLATGGPLPPPTAASRAPFDLRECTGLRDSHRDGRPLLGYWLRSREDLGGSATLQAAALAWASDLVLTRVVDVEHEHRPGIRVAASMDQTMWFHNPTRVDRWLLLVVQSPAYGGALGLSTGQFFDERGRLVTSLAQESLLRRTVPQG